MTQSETLQAFQALREYIAAIPADVVASLPAMPGMSADWLDEVEASLKHIEKDAARWVAISRDIDLADVAVVFYDCGQERLLMGEEADEAVDTAMEKSNDTRTHTTKSSSR